MADMIHDPKLCLKCGEPGAGFKCPCLGRYCSEDCQRAHWPVHKPTCSVSLAKAVNKAKRKHGKDDLSVARARCDAGSVHTLEGRLGLAEKSLLEARRIYKKVYGDSPHMEVAMLLRSIGTMYFFMGRFDDALSAQEESLHIAQAVHGMVCPDAAAALGNIGCIYLTCMKKPKEALTRFEQAHTILAACFGPHHPTAIGMLFSIGQSLGMLGQENRALEIFKKALSLSRIEHEDRIPIRTGTILINIAEAYRDRGMLGEAMKNYEEALEIYRRVHGDRHPDMAKIFTGVALTLYAQEKFEETLKACKKVIKIYRRNGLASGLASDDNSRMAELLAIMGNIYAVQGKSSKVLVKNEEAIQIFARIHGVDSTQVADISFITVRTKLIMGDEQGFEDDMREAARIYKKLGNTHEQAQGAIDLSDSLAANPQKREEFMQLARRHRSGA